MNRELHVYCGSRFFSGVTWVFFSHKVAPIGVEKPAYAGVFFAAHGVKQLGQHRDDWDNILLFYMESWNHWNHWGHSCGVEIMALRAKIIVSADC